MAIRKLPPQKCWEFELSRVKHFNTWSFHKSNHTHVESDDNRPLCHFHPPAQWMNDPNGTLFKDGYFHIFYQYNPNSDKWDTMHWGHTRTRDFTNWEYLPVALNPDMENEEEHCFSGCLAISKSGIPVILYTSVPPEESRKPNSQTFATGDQKLLEWKQRAYASITVDFEGLPQLEGNWRDPYIFQRDGRTFFAVSALIGDERQVPAILTFESMDDDLREWRYSGELCHFDNTDFSFLECPNIIDLKSKWILVFSPYGLVRYYYLNNDFKPEDPARLIDYNINFYATNTACDGNRRCILFGWVRGFEKGRGWNGCLAHPREIYIDDASELVQKPVEELKLLRENESETDAAGNYRLMRSTFDAEFSINRSTPFTILLCGTKQITIEVDPSSISLCDCTIPLDRPEDGNVRILFDRSVLEMFVGKNKAATFVIEDANINSFKIEGNKSCLSDLRIWDLKKIEFIDKRK
jgi:beta-fructofuranosidase